MQLMAQITAPENLTKAWHWLASRRSHSHHNNDYWHLRHHRQHIEPQIIQQLCTGTYRFSPCKNINGIMQWNAQDALVLKAIAMVLTKNLTPKLDQHCYHLPNRGWAKGCITQVEKAVQNPKKRYQYICRSDVNSYYATI